MKTRETFLRIVGIVGAGVLLVILASAGAKMETMYSPEDINIEIENAYENFFVNEEDVMELIFANSGDTVLKPLDNRMRLKDIEKQIEAHNFVAQAEVFRDLKGHLVVRARQNKPVARLIGPLGENAYVDAEGQILPVSSKYTARVPVVTGDYVSRITQMENISEDELAQALFQVIEYVASHPFWSMQIATIDMDGEGYLNLYTQVGDQRLEFGSATQMEKKFKKLEIFFKQIMPTQGWNAYSRVNVAYKDQIICE